MGKQWKLVGGYVEMFYFNHYIMLYMPYKFQSWEGWTQNWHIRISIWAFRLTSWLCSHIFTLRCFFFFGSILRKTFKGSFFGSSNVITCQRNCSSCLLQNLDFLAEGTLIDRRIRRKFLVGLKPARQNLWDFRNGINWIFGKYFANF